MLPWRSRWSGVRFVSTAASGLSPGVRSIWIGGELEDVDPAGRGRRQLEHRRADIAADIGIEPGRAQHMAGERGGGRLAIGAGDGNQARPGPGNLADEDLGVADHLDAGGPRLVDAPVRAGMGQGNARRQHQRRELPEIGGGEIADRDAGGSRSGAGIGAIVAGHHLGAARHQGGGAGEARAGEAEQRDPSALEAGGGEHGGPHLSFRVDRPISARTTAMIQNRITMVGSRHPFCSK